MAMRQIGIPARKVIERIERKRAAVIRAHELAGDSPKVREEDASELPPMRKSRGDASRNGNGKRAEPEGPAKVTGGGQTDDTTERSGITYRGHMVPALRIMSGRGMRAASANNGFPRPAARIPLALVVSR